MAAEELIMCPLMLGEPCVGSGDIRERNGKQVLVKCRFWITVQGQNPQTGETVNNEDCSFAWMPMLMIENSKVNRETGAAVESLRNENVSTGGQITNALMQLVEQAAKNRIEKK